ncbi:MAG: hypothetical protein U0794_10770 [Isosphaeraceae bacterium]
MATRTKRKATTSGASSAKTKAAAKPEKSETTKGKARPSAKRSGSSSGTKGKSSTGRIVAKVASRAGEVLDTMAAGAVVGAIKAAAQTVEKDGIKPVRGRRKSASPTGEVLGEIGPDVAVGAIAGAAEAVIPQSAESSPPASRTRGTTKKAADTKEKDKDKGKDRKTTTAKSAGSSNRKAGSTKR